MPPTELHTRNVAAAFSRKASVYDAFGEDHVNLERMRTKVYDHIGRHVATGSHLLELNAGTGLDAMRLAARGYHIHATDVSAGMVAAIEEKISTHQLQDQLQAQTLSFMDLDQLPPTQYDAIYSNSGGLNCVGDLAPVIKQLPRLLRPNGIVTWVIMPKFCPWELLLTLKDPKVGLRRWHRNGVLANVEGVQFRTWYHPAKHVQRLFGGRFALADLEALSLITPTADNKTFAVRQPRLYNALVTLDDVLSHAPLLKRWGDFYILSMRFLG